MIIRTIHIILTATALVIVSSVAMACLMRGIHG